MPRERFHTTLETEVLEYLSVLKIRKKFRGLNDVIEYLVNEHKKGESKNENNIKTKVCER